MNDGNRLTSHTPPGSFHELPLELALELERLCTEFEADWRSGRPCSIEAALAGVGDTLRPAAVRELVALDAFYQRRDGRSPRASDYASRFPDLDPHWLAGVVAGAKPNDQMAQGANTLTSRYELGEEIARGGMGVVYRATDTAFGRAIAVKVLHEKFAPTSVAARRFADEARIMAGLQHAAIPPVHDLGTFPDGRPFLR
jgi:hypothetical protein